MVVNKAKVKVAEKRAIARKRVEIAKQKLDKIPGPRPRVKKPLGGFVDFVREQGVIGLAIGLVLGTQVKSLVDQLLASFINPFLGLLLPGSGSLVEKTFHQTFRGKGEDFLWGAFVAQLISFLAVAAVIYFVFKGLRLDKLDRKKA